MSGRGGKRDGAGRPAGAVNETTKHAKMRLADLAREHSNRAFEILVDVAENGKTDSARITAAIAIIDRAFGRPCRASLIESTIHDDGQEPASTTIDWSLLSTSAKLEFREAYVKAAQSD